MLPETPIKTPLIPLLRHGTAFLLIVAAGIHVVAQTSSTSDLYQRLRQEAAARSQPPGDVEVEAEEETEEKSESAQDLLKRWTSGTSNKPKSSSPADLAVNGSIFYPTYIAENTVYDRGVADMPIAENSAAMARYMKEMPSKYNNRVTTSLNHRFFNLPVYVVDSRDPATPRVRVNVPEFRNPMVSPRMRKILFNDDIPIPAWARAANPQRSGDSAMAIYDIGTGIIREYFFILKDNDKEWTASYGGYYEHMFDLATKNYACQHTEGSDFVTRMIGAPGQIGIEEARRGEIRHAICFTMANARRGVHSWPALQGDGTDDNPDSPAQGQWFRLPPDLNIKKMRLKPMTELIAITVQKYGGFGSDKNLFCHAFNAEPGFVEEHLTGQDPWAKGGDLARKYRLDIDNLLNDFPWELTEWAPLDWGKPRR